MNDYYNRIDGLVQELLISARVDKSINKEIFDDFCQILYEIQAEFRNKETIPRKIVGLLFFIFYSLADEVETNDYQNELFRNVGKLEDILDSIFWESPFKE